MLAIGLVVDDAIVVLENIYRRIEHGEPPLLAAVDGSREIGFAVIATTLVLVAVFVPISFLQGNVGRLFREFGFTIAAAVVFSSLVALTLTPMMCFEAARRRRARARGFVAASSTSFFRAPRRRATSRLLRRADAPAVAGRRRHARRGRARGVLLFRSAAERARAAGRPRHDRSIGSTGPEGATLEYMDRHARMAEDIVLREVRDRRRRARHHAHPGRLRRRHAR